MKNNAKFINKEKIEGYVYSTGSNFNQLSERVTGENSKNPGTKYIGGDLDIVVDEAGLNVVTIHYAYVAETFGNGTENKTYGVLKRIIDNPDRMWINGGKDNAFKVQCTGIAIGLNDFIAADGKKVAAPRNENGFCTIVSELGPEGERNTFETDMVIEKVTHIDADPDKNIKEDFVTISGNIFGYGPVLLPISFTVRKPEGMRYFENLDVTPAEPLFTKVWGNINCMTIKTERKEESAFGEAAVHVYESKKREYLVTGTAKIPYDFGNEDVLTHGDLNKMMQDRQIRLAEIEKRFKDRKTKTNTATATPSANIPQGDFVF